MKKTIIFYSDSWSFGGHEAMSMKMIEIILKSENFQAVVFRNRRNDRFDRKLLELAEELGTLTIEDALPLHNGLKGIIMRFGILFFKYKIKSLAAKFQYYKPTLIICLQGNIEMSLAGIFAAKHINKKVISYIPSAKKFVKTNEKLGRIRDILNKKWYNLPSEYITISNGINMQLKEHTKRKIHVINNYVTNNVNLQSTSKFQKKIGVIGIIGLIDFSNKGQDFLVKLFEKNIENIAQGYRLLIIGDGPDFVNLKKMVIDLGLEEMVELVGWTNNPKAYLNKIDVLAIPSKYEGFPLVMIEAIAEGVPVIGTNVDGMKEFLPDSWVFDYRDEKSFMNALLSCKSAHLEEIRKLQIEIIENMCRSKFQSDFIKIVSLQ